MNPDEAASRRRHPTSRRAPAPLRAVHSDSRGWGRERGHGSASGRPSLLALAAVVIIAGGFTAAVWAGDWRIAATAVAAFLVLAMLGAYLDRRPPG